MTLDIKHILHSNILVHQYQNIYSVSSIAAFLCILSVPFISDKSTSDFKVRIVSASFCTGRSCTMYPPFGKLCAMKKET